ncbi:MAG: hypothetical protein MJ014_05610 [Methanocorpusculum sp.]|nr:hypothetical protein [Methanocorpusculum sp.]
MFNASGIFGDVQLVVSTTDGFTETALTQMTEGAVEASINPFGTLTQIIPLVSAVLQGIVQALAVAPLLISVGIPAWIAMPISVPIWVIYGVDILNWVVNRQP